MNFIERDKTIMKIADTFKNPSQQLKLIEELGELTREISKDIATGREISKDTISEIADVNILINQLLYLAGEDTKDKVKKQIEYKLQRTLDRINKEYYK